MIHANDRPGMLAALLPAAALVVGGVQALSQPVPAVTPTHEELAPAPGAPTAQVGVAVRRLGGQPLDHDFRALQGRELRLRELTIAPGGSITLHRHDQRPGVAYILEGQMT
jgi:quercetin dioxygenase-like cupin family protein